MPDLLAFSGLAVCLIVLVLLVIESGLFVGLVLPADSLLFGAGLIVGSGRIDVSIVVLATVAWAGAFLGATLGYGLGRRFGRVWLSRRRRVRSQRFVAFSERIFDRHGGFAMVMCRWFPGVRAIVPTLAGVGRMNLPIFLLINAFGAVLWAVGMVFLGYAASSVPWVRAIGLWAMIVVILIAVGYVMVHATRARKLTSRSAGEGDA